MKTMSEEEYEQLDHELDKATRWLEAKARAAQDRALAILGAKPGPGTDLLLVPTNPVSSFFRLRPLTAAGKAFLERIWLSESICAGAYSMRNLRETCSDWGLKVEVDWSTAEAERLD